ncbi:MAG: NTP transferase domain-containing protein [Lentisphaerae bacterium]|jgi:N-acetylgalactosamine kinase|nr:NTP transferase domain-containing protein [Lentisphaerota bacterium]MBT5604328.1 NTP transferase domain-containing protein [Lentisphaerota bacterium]MBT7060261.1 NTP transferase domain-containing protein [Lentisphaerota bacterium]MBT7847572.1 NTP transferase domain-containing protein [Lentisphaerota bacterium]
MDRDANTVCVILAGGRGKRMASEHRHKVCFPVAGVPAIVRAIHTYKQAGLKHFLLVVGQMSEQVMQTVSEHHPEVSFVYQTEPRGTGHAALVAIEALAAQNYAGSVMIVMGDKATRPQVVTELLDHFSTTQPDALLSVEEKSDTSTAGRVVEDEAGNVLGIVEVPDIRQARQTGATLEVAGKPLSPDDVEARSTTVNVSMYLFRFGVLHDALRRLSPSNAQGELYLTDTAEHIARNGRVELLRIADASDLMAFNTPDELLAIEEVVRAREGTPLVTFDPLRSMSRDTLKPAQDWLALLEKTSRELEDVFRRLYGPDSRVLSERRQACLEVVQAFIGQFGPDRPMLLCRAPGRINLMGRHVDHRGGFVNVMAINREVILAAAPRDDDLVRLRNLDVRRFPNREFNITALLREESWSDWMDFLASHTVRRILKSAPGDWSHYARAPFLRLQYERMEARLKGMDCMVSGDIPMGAGLSSSSALVVAFATAAVALNGLDVAMHDFIDLCGEGEWFVGSRGGSSDHAAIRTGQLGHVSRIGFFPFGITGDFRFPDDLSVVIAHSGSAAVKSLGARDVFNQRVACYELAESLLHDRWPAAAGMEHLRDLTPDRLGVAPTDIYRAISGLPDRPTRAQLTALVPPQYHPRMERAFATHANLGTYDLRGVALFGISECIRSAEFAEALQDGRLETIARAMAASHDGDRKVRYSADGKARKHRVALTNNTLCRLAEENADLSLQSGRYACSTDAIDQLVDLANATSGVVGAQLAGAGLGGCMMILVQANALDHLLHELQTEFYAPRKLPPNVHVCSPVAGAGLIGLDG